MVHQVIMAGFGGQGVMTMGKILAQAALKEGKNVSWLPSYGPEMRGGTANCHVVISDEPIANPIISEASTVIALNQPSLDKFIRNVISGGKLIVNSSLVKVDPGKAHANVINVPANNIANDLNNIKVVNMIMLGAYVKATAVVSMDTIVELVTEIFGQKNADLLKLNIKALEKGGELA